MQSYAGMVSASVIFMQVIIDTGIHWITTLEVSKPFKSNFQKHIINKHLDSNLDHFVLLKYVCNGTHDNGSC